MTPQGHRRYPWCAGERRTGSGAWRPGAVCMGRGGHSCKEMIQGAVRIPARPHVRVDFLFFVSCLSQMFTQLPCAFLPTRSGSAAFAAAAERRQPTLQGRRVDVHRSLDRPARTWEPRRLRNRSQRLRNRSHRLWNRSRRFRARHLGPFGLRAVGYCAEAQPPAACVCVWAVAAKGQGPEVQGQAAAGPGGD